MSGTWQVLLILDGEPKHAAHHLHATRTCHTSCKMCAKCPSMKGPVRTRGKADASSHLLWVFKRGKITTAKAPCTRCRCKGCTSVPPKVLFACSLPITLGFQNNQPFLGTYLGWCEQVRDPEVAPVVAVPAWHTLHGA
jgi:hypothetical protein